MKRLILAFLMAALGLFAAPISTHFLVDTSSISPSAGYVEFQFNQGNFDSDPATAVISGWASDATLGLDQPAMGTVTGGPLPASLTIFNDPGQNSYLHAISTFGSFMRFTVTLDVPAASGTASAGSTFGFFLWQEDLVTPALPTFDEVTGSQVTIDVNELGAVLEPSIWNSNGEVTIVPEPSTIALAGAGLVVAAFLRSRRRAR